MDVHFGGFIPQDSTFDVRDPSWKKMSKSLGFVSEVSPGKARRLRASCSSKT